MFGFIGFRTEKEAKAAMNFFNNTFIRRNAGTGIGNLLNLWYANDAEHNVRIKNYQFRNNIFWAAAGAKATDTNAPSMTLAEVKQRYGIK